MIDDEHKCTFYRTFRIIQYEHNNAHFTERFVLYSMNIIMHIFSYDTE